MGRPARPQSQHDYHHDMKVKPEAATAVIELLMMGGKTPETCWAVNKRQENKLKNFCIRLVIYLNCTMMHGLTNLKFIIPHLNKKRHFNIPDLYKWFPHLDARIRTFNVYFSIFLRQEGLWILSFVVFMCFMMDINFYHFVTQCRNQFTNL